MDGTLLIALWGAIVATIVLIWDIYKWATDGPKLVLVVDPSVVFPRGADHPGGDLPQIAVTVTNVGHGRTTLTDLSLVRYPSLLAWLRRKADETTSLVQTNPIRPFRHELDTAQDWTHRFVRTPAIERLASSGRCYCVVRHSMSQSVSKARLVIRA